MFDLFAHKVKQYKMSKSRNLLYNTTISMVNNLYDYLKTDDEQLISMKALMLPICFSMDVCTIHVGGRRRLGHSTMINNMMHSSSPSVGKYKCLTVTKTVHMAELLFHMENNTAYETIAPPSNGSVYSVTTLKHIEQTQAFRGIYFNTLDMDLCLVDNASMMTNKEIEYIYKTFHEIVKIFVMVQ